MPIYRLFNIALESEFPLPELAESDGEEPVFSVTLGSESDSQPEGFSKQFEFTDRQGTPAFWCGRRGRDHLLAFPGFAHYRITERSQIHCVPEGDCPLAMVRHLLLNQVIPRMLGSCGFLVVHASAVVLKGSGVVVAFLGNSGYGKSTLASSFFGQGNDLISDDGVLVCPGQKGPVVYGGLPGIRLLPDSLAAMRREVGNFKSITPFSAKRQLYLKERDYAPRPLAALFVLNDPLSQAAEHEVKIESMTGSEAMMALIQCLFSLDPTERAPAARSFQNAGELLGNGLPVYQLSYPRDHYRLPEVRQAVEDLVGCVG